MPSILRSSYRDEYFVLALGAYTRICESVGSPFALRAKELASNRRYLELFQLKVDPRDYTSVSAFADDYLVASILSKTQKDVGIDRQRAALESFKDSEAMCSETNERIFLYRRGHLVPLPEVAVALSKAQSFISRVLGVNPDHRTLDTIKNLSRFGPGATSVVHGWDARVSKKFSELLQLTPGLSRYWYDLTPLAWRKVISSLEYRAYNEVCTVPKNYKTDRTIAIEPHLNIYVQLGLGGYIRSRLRRFGLDISVQQEVNAEMARRAWVDGLSTVDLSSASDTISLELVHLLFPPKWAELFTLLRSPYGKLPSGELVKYEKISSMGNGFTFELETLLFWALAIGSVLSSGGRLKDDKGWRVVAYGDDLIVPRESFDVLSSTLNFCGFKVNKEKSFRDGNFFESCGHDYFCGVDVRPFFWKCDHYDKTEAILAMANSVRRYASRRLHGFGCDSRFLPAWLYLKGKIPAEAQRCRIPDGYGDVGLVSSFDETTPSRPPGKGRWAGWEGWVVHTRTLRPFKVPRHESGAYIASLSFLERGSAEVTSFLRGEPVRGAVVPVYRKSLALGEWQDLGNWV